MDVDHVATEAHEEITAAFRDAITQMFAAHVIYLCAFAKASNEQAINESARVMGQAVGLAIKTEQAKAQAAQSGLH